LFFVRKQQWHHFGKGTQCGTVLRENGEAFFFFLEMNQLETRIACGGHVYQWIGMK
jgi:hypothetical protein